MFIYSFRGNFREREKKNKKAHFNKFYLSIKAN